MIGRSIALAAVLKTDPDWSTLPAGTPASIHKLLRRCLERNIKQRLPDIGVARLEIDDALSSPAPSAPSKTPARIRRWLWPVLTTLIVALTAWGVWLLREPLPFPVRHFTIEPGILDQTFGRRAAISPNGRHIAYLAAGKLWIRDLDRNQPRELEGTTGAQFFFWSPDSQWIGFAVPGELRKIKARDGLPALICALTGLFRGGAWSPDGSSIVFSVIGGVVALYEVSARGGTPKVFHKDPQSRASMYALQFLSSSPHAVIFGRGNPLDQRIVVLNLNTRRQMDLVAGSYPVWSPDGYIIYQGAGVQTGLWGLPFSLNKLEPAGEAFPIVRSGGEPSLASDGTLVYVDAPRSDRQLVWRDRAGTKLGLIGQPQINIGAPDLSPDGRRVAVTGTEQGNTDIWIHEVDRPVKTRLTFDPGTDSFPAWHPDAKRVTFYSLRSGNGDIFLQAADGRGEAEQLTSSPDPEWMGAWAPDASSFAYTLPSPQGRRLWYLKKKPGGPGFEQVRMPEANSSSFNIQAPKVSPDGRFVAYVSNETGRNEVFVRPFPQGSGKWQISGGGAEQPRWSGDGKELFMVEGETLIAVSVSMKDGFSVGASRRLFQSQALRWNSANTNYDVSSDGKRFVLAELVEGASARPPSIHVIQNWLDAFRDRPAAGRE